MTYSELNHVLLYCYGLPVYYGASKKSEFDRCTVFKNC